MSYIVLFTVKTKERLPELMRYDRMICEDRMTAQIWYNQIKDGALIRLQNSFTCTLSMVDTEDPEANVVVPGTLVEEPVASVQVPVEAPKPEPSEVPAAVKQTPVIPKQRPSSFSRLKKRGSSTS